MSPIWAAVRPPPRAALSRRRSQFGWSAADVLPVANGLLHLGGDSLTLVPHTPRFFGPTAIPYAYDPDAPTPTTWLHFLNEVFPGDPESIALVQEWFGYCLTGSAAQQKILLMVGATRGGKGTIGRILTDLAGHENTASPKLRALSETFGLAGLVGKRIAVVGDVRFGAKTDTAAILENLLAISGEDGVEVNEKHKPQKRMRLPVRFTLASNEIPQFPDASAAIIHRLLILNFTQSFRGREDLTLEARISSELPGILLWAIEGLRRLRARGKFVQPASAGIVIDTFTDSASPISRFIEDELVIGPGFSSEKDDLYAKWCEWSHASGREWSGTKEAFAVKLLAAIPGLKQGRPRVEGGRVHTYEGVALRGAEDTNVARAAWVAIALDRYGRVPAPRHMVLPGYEGSPNLLGVPIPGEPTLALGDYIRRLKLRPDDPSGDQWDTVRSWADGSMRGRLLE